MRSVSLVAAVICVSSGCVFIFDDDDGPDVCAYRDLDEPAIAAAPLRDPGDLTCDSFGGTGCNPECGPCPDSTVPAVAPGRPIPPIPSWPICGHTCEGKSEDACSADPQCRVVKQSACAIGPSACLTDFFGCFPVDTNPDVSIDCRTADAWDCSRSNECTAYHSYDPAVDCASGDTCPRPFDLCFPEGQSPGDCYGQVICRALPPPCDAGKVPGIENGCYTGACIPQSLCGPQP